MTNRILHFLATYLAFKALNHLLPVADLSARLPESLIVFYLFDFALWAVAFGLTYWVFLLAERNDRKHQKPRDTP